MDSRYAASGLPATAPPGLEGVWAKLARAHHHFENLHDVIEEYLAKPPYRINREIESDYVTLTPEVVVEPPIQLAMIFGDFLHCLNSALDHTAWAFALTTTAAPNDHTAWPLYRKRRDFTRACKPGNPLEHIPSPVLAVMRDIQPCQDDEWAWIGRDLAAMRDLANEDKHRTLPVVAMVVSSLGVGHFGEEGKDSGIRFLAREPGGEPEIVQLPHDPNRPHQYQDMWRADVTIKRDSLVWRSGLEGIARHFFNQTEITLAGLKPHYDLLNL